MPSISSSTVWPGSDPAVELEAAAAGHRPGRDHVAGLEPLARRGVGQHRADVVGGAGGRPLAPELAVDPDPAGRGLPVGQLVGGEHVGADRVGEGLRLHDRAEGVLAQVLGLDVAGAPVVEDEPAADRRGRLLRSGVGERLGQHEGQLQLEVEVLGVARPPHLLAVGEHGGVVGDVEGGRLVEALVRLQLREGAAGDPLVAGDDLRHRRREEVLDQRPGRGDVVRLPEHEGAHRARLEGQDRAGGVDGGGAGSAAARSIAACAATRASSPRARKSTMSVSPGSGEPAAVPGLGDQSLGGASQLHRSQSGGLTLAIGWPASRKRGGGGPPHWLIAPKPPGQRFAS